MKELLLAAIVAVVPLTASAQDYRMTTPIAPGIAVSDKVESSIGTLNLSYGYPDDATVEKIYDNLDRSRALQAYLMAIAVVNQAGMRESLRKIRRDQPDKCNLGKSGRFTHCGADGQRQHCV